MLGSIVSIATRPLIVVTRPFTVITGLLPAVELLGRELRAMRGDLRAVVEGIEALRHDVHALQSGIDAIAGATESLDDRVRPLPLTMESMDERLALLHEDLGGVSSLAARVDRWPRLRRARPELET